MSDSNPTKREAKKRKTPKVIISGPAAHNQAFLTSIGQLIISWANNESVFLAILQALVPNQQESATVIWFSHKNTSSRLEIIWRLARHHISDKDLLNSLKSTISEFKGYTNVRNFYCHATYEYDEDLNLVRVNSGAATSDGDPIVFKTKLLGPATLNEINNITLKLMALNSSLWKLTKEIHRYLNVPLMGTQALRAKRSEDQENYRPS